LQEISSIDEISSAYYHETPSAYEPNKWVVYSLFGFSLIGIAGLHRLYLKKYLTGLLYLFTFGLFGIGTITDFFRLNTLMIDNK